MINVTHKQRIRRLNRIPLSLLIIRGAVFCLVCVFLALWFLICMLLCFSFTVITLRQQQSEERSKTEAFDH